MRGITIQRLITEEQKIKWAQKTWEVFNLTF